MVPSRIQITCCNGRSFDVSSSSDLLQAEATLSMLLLRGTTAVAVQGLPVVQAMLPPSPYHALV